MESKVCCTCKVTKPLDAFYRSNARKDGHQTRCKACCKADKTAHNEISRKSYKKYIERNKELLLINGPQIPISGTKICPTCMEELPISEFGNSSRWPDGLQRRCLQCTSVANQKSHIAHREKRKEKAAIKRKEFGDEIREHRRMYRDRHHDEFIEYFRKYREEHINNVRKYARDWSRRHPAQSLDACHRRRTRKKNAFVQKVNRKEVFERDGWICQYCGEPVDPNLNGRHPMMASLDHIIPISKGGTHEPRNVQLVHFRCNCKKGDKYFK